VVGPKETVLPTLWLLSRIEACCAGFVNFTVERGEHES
jgi:hypothetical protein